MGKFYSDKLPLFHYAICILKTVRLWEGKLIPAPSPDSFYWGCTLNYYRESRGGHTVKWFFVCVIFPYIRNGGYSLFTGIGPQVCLQAEQINWLSRSMWDWKQGFNSSFLSSVKLYLIPYFQEFQSKWMLVVSITGKYGQFAGGTTEIWRHSWFWKQLVTEPESLSPSSLCDPSITKELFPFCFHFISFKLLLKSSRFEKPP